MNVFNTTRKLIFTLQKEKSENKRLQLLYKFIVKMWVYIGPSELEKAYNNDDTTWNKLYYDLDYFSDRWNFLRLYSVYTRYLVLKKQFDKNQMEDFVKSVLPKYVI